MRNLGVIQPSVPTRGSSVAFFATVPSQFKIVHIYVRSLGLSQIIHHFIIQFRPNEVHKKLFKLYLNEL